MFSRYAVSVGALWRAALENPEPNVLNEYPRLFKQEQVERMERYLEERYYYVPSEYHVRDGLVLLALGQDETRAQLIFDYATRTAAKVYTGNPPDLELSIAAAEARGEESGVAAIERLKAFVCMAIAKTACMGWVPDCDLLLEGARPVLSAYRTRKKPLHFMEHSGVLLATLAALIARDLELAKALLAIRKTCPGFPLQFAMFKRVVAAMQAFEDDGVCYLRVVDEGVHQFFFEVFNSYRCPVTTSLGVQRDEYPLISAPIGNYLFSWLYLLSFADPPTSASNWTRLREVMSS
ncbi:MAG: hypothetical protein AB7V26_14105 [Lysobacterales bacterium]